MSSFSDLAYFINIISPLLTRIILLFLSYYFILDSGRIMGLSESSVKRHYTKLLTYYYPFYDQGQLRFLPAEMILYG
jgi:hypothetical protein